MFHDQQPARPSAANSGTWGCQRNCTCMVAYFLEFATNHGSCSGARRAALSAHGGITRPLCWRSSGQSIVGLFKPNRCSTITVGSTQWLVLFPWSCSSMMLAVTFAIEVEFSLDSTELYNQSWNIRFRHDQTAVVDISAKLNYY